MALDHGKKTIGVAISDAERRLAQPVSTIQRTKLMQDIAQLGQLMAEYQPAALIIGYPLNMDGSEGPRCQSVRAFVRELEQHIDRPMLLWDERHSSNAAQEQMIDAGIRAAKREYKIDAAAAAVILESLLNRI